MKKKLIKRVLIVILGLITSFGVVTGIKAVAFSCCETSCTCPGGCPEGYGCTQSCAICWTFGPCYCASDSE